MAGTMDSYVSKGDEIKDQLNQGVEEAGDKARDFEGVKQGLSGMPGGLDPDLLQMISDAEEQGRSEARADIEQTVSKVIDNAKRTGDSLKSDVQQKVSDDQAASSRLAGISSKYGKAAIDSARTAIDQNAATGQDLMSALDSAMSDADSKISSIKDSL